MHEAYYMQGSISDEKTAFEASRIALEALKNAVKTCTAWPADQSVIAFDNHVQAGSILQGNP